jgi:hypothetical protein
MTIRETIRLHGNAVIFSIFRSVGVTIPRELISGDN